MHKSELPVDYFQPLFVDLEVVVIAVVVCEIGFYSLAPFVAAGMYFRAWGPEV